jgi:hypothetical protein
LKASNGVQCNIVATFIWRNLDATNQTSFVQMCSIKFEGCSHWYETSVSKDNFSVCVGMYLVFCLF